MIAVLSFLVGILLTSVIFYVFYSKKIQVLKEELITVSAKTKSTEELQEIIKRDLFNLPMKQLKMNKKICVNKTEKALKKKSFH